MSACRSRARYESNFLRAALALAASSLAGCYWEGHPHEQVDPPPSFDLWEQEPNDSHCCPDFVGTLFVDDQVVIAGTVHDDMFDPFDGFEFQNGEPLEVHFVLEPVGTWADLDLCVWDPSIGDFRLLLREPGLRRSWTVHGSDFVPGLPLGGRLVLRRRRVPLDGVGRAGLARTP
jgi:hypothetical protein